MIKYHGTRLLQYGSLNLCISRLECTADHFICVPVTIAAVVDTLFMYNVHYKHVHMCFYFQEVVCALHGLVVLYEKQFQIAALRSSESERMGASNLSTSLTPTGWIHVSIEPPEVETSFEASSSGATSSIVTGRSITSKISRSLANGIARSESPPTLSDSSVGSGGSEERFLDSSLPKRTSMTQSFGPSPSSSMAAKSVYNHVWKGLVFLASDPCSKVHQPAQFVVHSLHDKVCLCTRIH